MPFPYTQQTWTDGVSSASAARFGVIEAGVALAGVTGTGASPPGSPTDGMIWRLPAASGSGIYWFFQYDSSQATNKWVFTGGPAWTAEVATAENTASTTYVDLATTGPSITIPRAGDYLVEAWTAAATNAVQNTLVAVKIGAAATADADGSLQGSAASGGISVMSFARVKAFAASDVAKLQYRVTGGTGTFQKRVLKITPIRVI